MRSTVLQVRARNSVEDDSVPGSRSNRILQFRTGSESEWISTKLYRIRHGYPKCVKHCSQMLNQRFFRILTGLDQAFAQHYRMRIGLEYKMKILDWIWIVKICDPFNTSA